MSAKKTQGTLTTAALYRAAPAVLALFLVSHQASAEVTTEEILKRLEALEKSNAQLKKENEALKTKVNQIKPKEVAKKSNPLEPSNGFETTTSVVREAKVEPTAAVLSPSSGPLPSSAVVHDAPATNPIGGLKDISIGDNTRVSIYGAADLSFDHFNVGVFDQGWKSAIASNSSYFGVRARHNLSQYGYPGWSFLLQYEQLVEVAATPTERAAFGSRNSYLGVDTPYGALKVGKHDTPYKVATAPFDPFANTIGDYNSIMGNTGGDNRAEFDWRMPHAIWYESPTHSGFQFSAMFSPGQNFAKDNSDFAYGEFNCTGSTPRGSGSGFPSGSPIGVGACTDGSFGNAFSIAGTYKGGPLTLIAAYELHRDVNRNGDNLSAPDPTFTSGVHDEWAAKVGAGYRIDHGLGGPLQLYGAYEWLRREGTAAAFNERSRDGFFFSATQSLSERWSASASWAHASKTPGNPAVGSAGLSFNIAPGNVTYDANKFSDTADMVALGARYKFTQWASWYIVGAQLSQGQGAHYCLGASGHAYQLCSRDANNDTIGGATIKAVSTGLTFTF